MNSRNSRQNAGLDNTAEKKRCGSKGSTYSHDFVPQYPLHFVRRSVSRTNRSCRPRSYQSQMYKSGLIRTAERAVATTPLIAEAVSIECAFVSATHKVGWV